MSKYIEKIPKKDLKASEIKAQRKNLPIKVFNESSNLAIEDFETQRDLYKNDSKIAAMSKSQTL